MFAKYNEKIYKLKFLDNCNEYTNDLLHEGKTVKIINTSYKKLHKRNISKLQKIKINKLRKFFYIFL